MEPALQQSTDLYVFPHEEADMLQGSTLLHSSAKQSTKNAGANRRGDYKRQEAPQDTVRPEFKTFSVDNCELTSHGMTPG